MKPLIQRRDFVKAVGMGTASLAMPGCLVAERPKPEKPNFIFILIDDLGWKDAGFMGSRYYETPNIDKLARQGITFSDAYAAAPNCAPSRACLLSGQYSPRHGVYTVDPPDRGPAHLRKLIPTANRMTLDSSIVTIAEALKPAGYAAASMGKWHLGDDPDHGPVSQGFDVNVGGGSTGHPNTYFSPYGNNDLADGPEGEYLTDRLTDEALAFIEQHRDRPFFLYLSHYAVHLPLQAKENLIEKYRSKEEYGGHDNPTYAAMIESIDQGVGRIMDRLDELGLAEDTVVFFFSDNGGHGAITSMEPLRGSKGMLYEGGVRGPMIVRRPGQIKPGGSCDVPVIIIDFYPTILEMADVPRPHGQVLDGESIVPLLRGRDRLQRDAIYWHFPAYLEAYRGMESPWRTTPAGAVRQGDWKLIEFFEDGRLELYNLKEDIGERNDLAGAMSDKVEELHRLLTEWREAVNAPVPTERNPLYKPDTDSPPSAGAGIPVVDARQLI